MKTRYNVLLNVRSFTRAPVIIKQVILFYVTIRKPNGNNLLSTSRYQLPSIVHVLLRLHVFIVLKIQRCPLRLSTIISRYVGSNNQTLTHSHFQLYSQHMPSFWSELAIDPIWKLRILQNPLLE